MKQKGQGIIEFALIVPFLIGMGVAIVYMGIMFLDYTQYSNAARAIARDIALQTDSTTRTQFVALINKQDSDTLKSYSTPFSNIYTANWEAKFYKEKASNKLPLDENNPTLNAGDASVKVVQVTVSLRFADDVEERGILQEWGIIPSSLKPITYRMVID